MPVVELVFLLLIMKLPILYLVGVCYWAIRAEPKPEEGAHVLVPVVPAPRTPPRRGPRRPVPRGGPVRREPRVAGALRVRPSR